MLAELNSLRLVERIIIVKRETSFVKHGHKREVYTQPTLSNNPVKDGALYQNSEYVYADYMTMRVYIYQLASFQP